MQKVALITGATRGIGKEIALVLSKEKCDIALNYRSYNESLEKLKKEVEENGVKCELVQGDVSNFEDCEKMVKETVEKLGKIDVLVNNAGITKDGLLMRMKKEDFKSVLDINLIGTFNVTRQVIPYMMKEKEGRIVKSPMVGTFYSKASPTAKPYVEVGSIVKKGDILCIIEAMKLMNEIESEYDGKVVEILVNDGDMVDYGKELFVIK